MKTSPLKFIFSLLILLQIAYAEAQIDKGALKQRKKVSNNIAPTDVHQYTLNLKENQFAFLKLMQHGVDMKVETFDSEGKKMAEFDSPNGKHGLELFTVSSTVAGAYRIDVSPYNAEEPEGDYSLWIEIIKPKAVTMNDQVDELFTAWSGKDNPGASVAVVKDGAIIYKNGYGMANLEYDIPNSPNTIFHVASVSKQFTVFALLLLESQGKLSLDDDVRRYIPEVPNFGPTITLRHLATHTSGMRDQWNLLALAGWRLDDVITKEHVLKLVSSQKELNFDPGEELVYCNTGFTLLAEVVARVSEMSFAEFTEDNIFKPLKMNNTLFYDDHEKIVKNRAYSYRSASNGYKKSVLSYANVGATSLFTTVEDLSLWSLNFSNPKAGNMAIIEKMNTKTVLNNGKEVSGAMGQFVGKYKGLNEIQHGGADAGYRTYLTRFPDQNFAVVVFSNSANFNSGGMAHKIVDIYLKDQLETKPKEEAKGEIEEATPTEEITVDQEILQSYVGDYELQPGFIITVTEADSSLSVQATGQPKIGTTAMSDNKFKLKGVEAEIEFLSRDDGSIETLKLYQNGRIMEAPRMASFDKSAVDLTTYQGSYYSDELATYYHIHLEDDKLVVKHKRHSDFTLELTKEDSFASSTWFFGQLEFVRGENQKIKGFTVNAGRVRNLYFERFELEK
ncbi:MAG: serine hydrolase [Bacteroidota bacterium]